MSESTQKALSTDTRATGGGFVQLLKQMGPQIQAALPKHMDVDRVSRLVLTEFRKNENLGKCTQESVAGSIIMLSQMGLEIGVLGQAFLVPYWNGRANRYECQGIPGWQGIVDLVNRSGRSTVWSGAVYDGDLFDYELGSNPFVRHKPGDDHGMGHILYTYAIGKVKGSEFPVIEVWSNARLVKHRDTFNKVGERHYSFKNWEAYARKVPLLQVAKYMPKSVELQKALDVEGAAERGVVIDLDAALTGDIPQQPEEPTPPPKQPEPEKEKPKARGKSKPAEEPKAQEPASGGDGGPPVTFDDITKALANAKTVAEVDQISDLIRSMPAAQQPTLSALANSKKQMMATAVDLKLE